MSNSSGKLPSSKPLTQEVASSLQDRISIVTGASRGIGAETTKLLLRSGARVIALSRSLDRMRLTLESELREYGQDRLHLITGDTSRENDILGVYEWAEDHWGPVNLLIANAAIAPRQSLLTLSLEEWDQVQRTNVTGPFLLSRELFRRLPEQQIADIVNVASLGGIRGTEKFPGLTAYSVSKFALVGLTECLAAEGRARGIRVNAVAPGAVNTQMLREAAPHLSTRTEPLDIAKVIVYLADREASGALNGSVLEIYSNENGEN